ncbi:helix-turn-helix domain-containing protein [Clostridium ljungdahlii]|uniref:Helix-turn-helix domain-containing protein n=1 Tax=Clostridium ljungdahlii TaxID=1538 RepID=A0A166RL56_9CLOT|nr:helix-turn-helix domain-containing protein [Clostridium ljungdahlii]OAA90893.1 hypothetical protein WY13_00959 [Clostridium ljungdahlii]
MVELFDTQFVDDGKGNTDFLITFNINVLRDKVFPLLTASELKIWLTILSFTNLQGTCFPSQAKISEISNISKTTVNNAIKKLVDIEVNGEPLLKRDVVGHIRKKSIYSVAREADEGEAKGTMTPQMVIELFCKAFEKEYNTKYNVVWQRDTRPVKTKLIKNYTDDEIKTIIEIVITQYKKRWSSPKFPTPTITAMCGWLSTQAMTIAKGTHKTSINNPEKFEVNNMWDGDTF